MADWYWASRRLDVAEDAFIIADGKDELFRRIRSEIDDQQRCTWLPIHPGRPEPELSDILELILVVVPTYRVNHNRFVLEAAKIPAFAAFLRHARGSLSNYVSNPIDDSPLAPAPYSSETVQKLGSAVSATLNIDDDWYEY